MKTIHDIRYYMLDMDGTFYLGNKIIDGSLDFLKTLEDTGREYIFLTNNSSKNSSCYKEKLLKMGCEVDESRIFTSGEATAIYLNKRKPSASLFVLGTKYLKEELKTAGFEIIEDRSKKPDFVVLGFDTDLTYESLWIACDFIREGISYIATHTDFNCPLEGGKFMPDAGAITAFIKASTGKTPLVIGKPSENIVDAICVKYGWKKEEIAMVGDRLYTDILLGEKSGISSILVYSGETSKADYKLSKVKASFCFENLAEISKVLLEDF